MQGELISVACINDEWLVGFGRQLWSNQLHLIRHLTSDTSSSQSNEATTHANSEKRKDCQEMPLTIVQKTQCIQVLL